MEDIMSFVEIFKNNIFDILNKHSSEVSNFESIKNYINSSTDLIEVHKKIVSKINLDFTLILLFDILRYKYPAAKFKWFHESDYYVEPEEIFLSKEESYQHISLLKTLKALFKNDQFNREYFSSEEFIQLDKIDSFEKSESFRKNDLFQKFPNAIQIIPYFDDYQTGTF